ncbi:hypothetical protein CEXT_586811 [Caerostris extrusa]|uniref:Uncharacterized protein n=1 Tax=Caerostris extrusa TaxID=172846 RepID=A0AAV4P3P9_CAEEX|nr:hypothetical protein CEXT_586811 [Caerostris extrusa]
MKRFQNGLDSVEQHSAVESSLDARKAIYSVIAGAREALPPQLRSLIYIETPKNRLLCFPFLKLRVACRSWPQFRRFHLLKKRKILGVKLSFL